MPAHRRGPDAHLRLIVALVERFNSIIQHSARNTTSTGERSPEILTYYQPKVPPSQQGLTALVKNPPPDSEYRPSETRMPLPDSELPPSQQALRSEIVLQV
jgi:hypothetical protein